MLVSRGRAGGRRGRRTGRRGAGGRALRLRRQVDRRRDLGLDLREERLVAGPANALHGDQPAADDHVVVRQRHEALHAVEEVREVEEVALELQLERHGLQPGRSRCGRRAGAGRRSPPAVVEVWVSDGLTPEFSAAALALVGGRPAALFAASTAPPGWLCAVCAAGRHGRAGGARLGCPRRARAPGGRSSPPRRLVRGPVAIFVKRMPVPAAAGPAARAGWACRRRSGSPCRAARPAVSWTRSCPWRPAPPAAVVARRVEPRLLGASARRRPSWRPRAWARAARNQ